MDGQGFNGNSIVIISADTLLLAATDSCSQMASGAPEATVSLKKSALPAGDILSSTAMAENANCLPCFSASATFPEYCSAGARSPEAP